jgi:serine/threonine protein kinase
MSIGERRKSISFDGALISPRFRWVPLGADLIGNYVIEKTIGYGTYGVIKKGHHRVTRRNVAIKCIPHTPESLGTLSTEIAITTKLKGTNHIIKLFEVIQTKEADETYMVLEYVDGRDLLEYISNQTFTENEGRRVFGQIARALEGCHAKQICHRDLKVPCGMNIS